MIPRRGLRRTPSSSRWGSPTPSHDPGDRCRIRAPYSAISLTLMRRAFLAVLVTTAVFGEVPTLPPLREQARIQQEWLRLRLERNLPVLMRKHGAQMWIVACREYAEDPAFFSLVSATVFAARRTTIYVFYDRGADQPLERLALGGESNGGLYTVYRDP